MAKVKITELEKQILSQDFEIEETDYENITKIALIRMVGRLVSKPN
jgi:hypothetical protein